MPRYRCFCMTEDNRVITGTFIRADNVGSALRRAWGIWAAVKGFHHAELWLDDERVDDPAQSQAMKEWHGRRKRAGHLPGSRGPPDGMLAP